jgi:hypothetical protein
VWFENQCKRTSTSSSIKYACSGTGINAILTTTSYPFGDCSGSGLPVITKPFEKCTTTGTYSSTQQICNSSPVGPSNLVGAVVYTKSAAVPGQCEKNSTVIGGMFFWKLAINIHLHV